MSLLQKENSDTIDSLFEGTGFWDCVAADPFSRPEWREALRVAPTIKANFFTILSLPDRATEAQHFLENDRRLARCFRG
jgi:glycerol-1-phosphate dehydrogenase [NAD(P)+]